jgi:hypothetical protein
LGIFWFENKPSCNPDRKTNVIGLPFNATEIDAFAVQLLKILVHFMRDAV